MNRYLLSLCLAILLLTSCKDDEPLPVTDNLLTSVKAYDLDNNGNSADSRVDFVVLNNLNVSEYRIMVIPSSSSSSFTVSRAVSIPETSFEEVNTVPFENVYIITRLLSNLLDVNNEQIRNDLEYVVAVLVVGIGNHQLSGFSRPFTLTD